MQGYLYSFLDKCYDIKHAALKVGKANHMNTLGEIHQFLYDNTNNRVERKVLRSAIYNELKGKMSISVLNTNLEHALLYSTFRVDDILDKELLGIINWLKINGRKFRKAQVIFRRPAYILNHVYKNYVANLKTRPNASLTEMCYAMFCYIKYSPIFVFDVKGETIPKEYLEQRKLLKITNVHPQMTGNFPVNANMSAHRYYSVQDFNTLFSFVLSHSRSFVLDSPPSAYSIRFLTYPVNQLFGQVDWMILLFYLFVYFVHETPNNLTMRSFLHFLTDKLVTNEEKIPYQFINDTATGWRVFEFTGFSHGNHTYVEYSTELDNEVLRVNEISYPPDDEIKEMLKEYLLYDAVKYSNIIPTEMERDVELLDAEGWKARREEEKKEKEEKKMKKILVETTNKKKKRIQMTKGMRV